MTARDLSVTRATREDAPALIAANQENRAYHQPWVEPFTDPVGFEDWFARIVTGATVSMIARTPEGGIIGVINLSQIVLGDFRSCYCGYYGMASQAGRGLMTEAVRQAIRIAFTEIGLHRVEANIQPNNHRSIALVRRVGFRLEGFSPSYLRIHGVWRDHERWALVDDAAPPLSEPA
jgi:ribosomal-protein-alanine N-acetyltransferase